MGEDEASLIMSAGAIKWFDLSEFEQASFYNFCLPTNSLCRDVNVKQSL